MALVQNDQVLLTELGVMQDTVPVGIVITAGANPVISWDGQPSVTYSALAAPLGVTRSAAAPAADLATWLGQRVRPNPNVGAIPNPSGRAVGTVVKVLLLGDPPTVLSLIVKTDSGLFYSIAAGAMEILPLA